MECILDCNYLLLRTPLGECKIQFHRGMECILDCTFSLDVGMYEQAGKRKIIKAEEATNKSMQNIRGCENEVGGGVGGRKQWQVAKAEDLIG